MEECCKKEVTEEIEKECTCKDTNKSCKCNSSNNCAYGLGVIGAAVFFIGQATSFWTIVLALLKAIVWPAFMVYELFKFFIK